MDYQPLEAYGIVGNLQTVALVGRDGAIDWCCLPHVESSSTFARILDIDRGGHLSVQPTDSFESTQAYVDRTNVLETEFRTATGRVSAADFMPVPEVAAAHHTTNQSLYRHVECEAGPIDLRVEFQPRFDYARTVPTIEPTDHGVRATSDNEAVCLSSTLSFSAGSDAASATTTLEAGEDHWIVIGHEAAIPVAPAAHVRLRADVERYWREWAHDCRSGGKRTEAMDCPIAGEWHDLAVRSSLVLKLLTHADTGAICAAPTTSLPEVLGGIRNWDYRYNWIRDAAFTVRALSELGHVEEASDYFDLCLTHCGRGPPAEIQPVYGLHGGDVLPEETLEHLSGYRGSTPVRIGNAAADQHQLDVYGELVNGVFASAVYGNELEADDWAVLRDVVDYVSDAWREPDVGIWEVRTDPRHFTYSKVMCWVALDRGIRIVEETEFDGPVERWRAARRTIRETVLDNGYSESADSFVRSFDEQDTLDATGLLLPLVGFLPFDDDRIQSTIDATLARLTTDDGLVARYEGDDGLPGEEGAFVICSFWLVTALARSGRLEEARGIFEEVVGYASPLGLLAEQIDPETGEGRGNYPQAFSHIGLINSVISLFRARESVETAPAAPDLDGVAEADDVAADARDGTNATGEAASTDRSPSTRPDDWE